MNCKPGDMAIIVRCTIEENIGHVVHVHSSYGEVPGYGFCWNVDCPTPLIAVSLADNQRYRRNDGYIPDDWLRPISGVPVHDEERGEVTA
ncbi:hypothetical protein V8918_02840 [Ralstonia mannitolilytica]|uniref:hypothetical protein n=1 Tax=Ralstonia mannitolilytica TaxID=105219 RepID=UPI003B8419BB